MTLKIAISVVAILAGFSLPSKGLPFEDYRLASVAEFEEPAAELRRDKRTLTTICVEIKPSTPYEEPYFMCKGTDSPKYSKGSSDSSDSYSSAKPSYKPSKPSTKYVSGESDSYHSGVSKNHDYHVPSKPEYHIEHSKYERPSSQSKYESAKEYSSAPLAKDSYEKNHSYNGHIIHHSDTYSNYEGPQKESSYASAKPSSYAEHHDNQDEYSKSHPAHKVTYVKPVPQSDYISKLHAYSQENPPTYDHRHQPTGYSKPSSYESQTSPTGGYNKPSNSYKPSEYPKPSSYDHDSTHDSGPSYDSESYSKTSYSGESGDGHSYSAPPETKVLYSKPSSYPAKQISYEHADDSQYEQEKPKYNEHPSSKPYSKATQDYGKPTAPSYTSHEEKTGYEHQQQNYRMMPQELLQPTWEPQPQSQSQPQQMQYDGFGYRSYGAPLMEYQNLETSRMMNHESQLNTGSMEGPLRFDLLDANHDGPTLQSSYQHSAYPSTGPPVHQVASYSPVAPSYSPPIHYGISNPSYPAAAYPSIPPSYASVPPPPPYVPLPVASPTYAPAAPSYVPATPACQHSYMYSFQPVIMPVPCYSMSAGYTSSSYVQPLGTPLSQQSLQDHSRARSETNSEANTQTVTEDSSDSQESSESDKKPDSGLETTQTSIMKSENLKKPSHTTEEKHQQTSEKNSQDQVEVPSADKPMNTKEDQAAQTAATSAPQKSPDNLSSNTKQAYKSIMEMAKIAAQLRKDDNKNGPAEAKAAAEPAQSAQANGKPSEPLAQFSRRK